VLQGKKGTDEYLSLYKYKRELYHHDHVGFILGIQGCFTIQKSIDGIPYIHRLQKRDAMIISLHVIKSKICSR
jgi:hypothetical protein